jgi:putative transposase
VRRETSRVSFLMCPFCVRALVPSKTTYVDAASGPLSRHPRGTTGRRPLPHTSRGGLLARDAASIARQNRCRHASRATDGRPGDRIRGRPARSAARRRTCPIATLLIEALRRPVETAQYTSIRYTGRLDELGVAPSVGSKGDAYDNAMAEAWVATFKSELVDGCRLPSFEHAEHEVLHWVGFYNAERLHEALGDLPPGEYEHLKCQDRQPQCCPPDNRASNGPRVVHFLSARVEGGLLDGSQHALEVSPQ